MLKCERLISNRELDGVHICGQPADLVKDPWGIILAICDEHNQPYNYPIINLEI